MFSITKNFSVNFVCWIFCWLTKYSIVSQFRTSYFFYLLLPAFAIQYCLQYMALRMWLLEFEYSMNFFYFNPSKVLCSCSGFSFSSFFFFVIPWIRNTFFLFYHERFHSFIWFVIDIQTAFLLLFLFQLLKYNHYANRALHQGNQDQLANNDLLDYHQGNGLN